MSDIPAMIHWYRVPLSKEKLRELTQRSDWKGFLQTVPYLLLLVVTGTATYYSFYHLPLWLFFVLLLVHGGLFAFMLNGFHELVHGTVFKSKWLNAVFLRIFAFLSWNSHVRFRASHMRHHASTLHPPDDEEVVLPIRLTAFMFFKCALVNPLGLIKVTMDTVSQSVGHMRTHWEHVLFPRDATIPRRHLATWARILLLGHLAIIVVSIATGHWLFAVVTSFARYIGGGFQWVCNITQHIGLQDNVPDFRLCCRTIHVNPILGYFYFHMNYHTEHHMYAAVPCYNLKKLHQAIEPQMPRISHGLIPAWKEIFTISRLQQKNPSYQHAYELPRLT